MYAFVTDNAVRSVGSLPESARRLDNGSLVIGLADATKTVREATGWYEVVDTPRPADTAQVTYDRSVELVQGTPTVTWTQRPKTTDEKTGDTHQANSRTIEQALLADLADLQAIIADTNANINASPAARIKTIARAQRRLIRRALALYDATD